MQVEQLYLRDIVEAADAIAGFLNGVDRTSFLEDAEKKSAIAFQFTVIGEAVRNLPDDLKRRYPDIAWTNAPALRNLITHRYFAIDWTIIFDTAVTAIPNLRQQIASILANEYPEDAEQ